MASHDEVVERYFDVMTGKSRLKRHLTGSRVFVDGQVLYSYGRHFPLAVPIFEDGKIKGFMLNGDKYSVSTSRHQSIVEAGAKESGLPFATIPFSALRSAGISPGEVEILDTRRAVLTRVMTRTTEAVAEDRTEVPWDELPDHTSVWSSFARDADGVPHILRHRHFLGGSLIRATVTEMVPDGGMTDDHHPLPTTSPRKRVVTLLSDWDRNEPEGKGYFLCEVPGNPSTIEEAYEALKPPAVLAAEAAGIEVKRQGDIFAIPLDGTTLRDFRKKGWTLSKHGQLLTTNHVATDVLTPSGEQVNHHVARGTLRHVPQFRRPDHVRVSLGKTWHLIVKNTVPLEVVA